MRAFATIALLVGTAAAQSPAELAQEAASAMQRHDYAAAEKAYREFIRLSPDVPEAYSNLALACYSEKKFACAEEGLSGALKLAPNLFVPNYLLGEIRFQQGRYPEALPPLKNAVAAEPARLEARRLYAATLVGLKQYQRATEEYREALRIDPNDVDSYYGLGSVYLQIGRNVSQRLAGNPGYASLMVAQHYESYPEWQSLALNAYQDAIARLVEVPGIRVGYAKVEIARKEWDVARKALEAELRLDPQSYEARFHLARVALAQGDPENALRWLDEAASIRPEFFNPLPPLAVEWAPATRTACEAALANRPESFATDYLRSAPGESGGGSTANPWAAKAESAREAILAGLRSRIVAVSNEQAGLDLLKHKRYERGLEILLPLARRRELPDGTKLEIARALYRTQRYEEMIHLFAAAGPGAPEANYLLALSYKEVALAKLTRMTQLAPESARSHQVLGDALFAQGRFVDAAGEYMAAVKLEPGNPELHFLLGNAYFKQMQFSLALGSFERVIQLDPLNAEAYLMRGDSLVQLGETAEAVPSLKKGLELNPHLAQAHVLLGKAYSAEGRLDEALRHLEQGAAADKDGSVHYQLAVLYRKLKQPDKAAEALRLSQELRKALSPPVLAGEPRQAVDR